MVAQFSSRQARGTFIQVICPNWGHLNIGLILEVCSEQINTF